MKKIMGAMILILVSAVPVIAQGNKPANPPTKTAEKAPAVKPDDKPPAPLTVEQKNEINGLLKQSLENNARITQVQEKYNNALRQDTDYVDATQKLTAINKKLNEIIAKITKDVDQTKWRMDYEDTLDWLPIKPAPAATPQKP